MTSLERDSQLDRAMEVEGYKVLPPCVLYGKIGQGGMGAVYRGRHLNLDIDVAVKCLRPGLVESDDQFVVRFRREARAAAQINHQNVIRVFDVAEEKGLHYIVMELVQGETARERVLRKKSLAVGEALEIVYEAAKGLGEAHRKGFIHRDIKPDNIMISSSGQVKVADLGLAKPAMADDQASLLSGTNLVMGTPQYMPPEQWENTSTVTPAADVWAMGATLYYLLVGVEAIAKDSLPRIMQRIVMQPFPDVRTLRPEVPADVAALIVRATQPLPGARYQDAQELAEAIEALATRRQALRDRDAAPTTQQNTLLSPPPAKTLAKIKFWLDEQGQRTVASAPAVAAAAASPVAAAPPVPAKGLGLAWSASLVAALLAVAVVWWQPWRATGDALASVRQLEQSKQYVRALAEVERVYEANPSLTGKADVVARLHAARAEELATAGSYPEAFAELELSLTAANSTAVRGQREQLRERIEVLVKAAWQPTPVTTLVPRQGKVELRGVFVQELVKQLTVGAQVVSRLADGSFRVEVDPRAADRILAQATLWDGRTVELAPFNLRYEVAPAAPVALTAEPSTLELVDDQEQILTVRVPRGAELRIDGTVVARSGTEDLYLHHVRSDQESPLPIELVAHQEGLADSTLRVPVTRRSLPFKYTRVPQFVDVKKVDDALVTGQERVQILGALNERAEAVLVNGVALSDLQWGDKGAFQGSVALAAGVNELRIVAQKRLRQSAFEVLRITRLLPPTLVALEPATSGASVDAPSCLVIVRADAGTRRVSARGAGPGVNLKRDATGDLYRGAVNLVPGSNLITVEAVNGIDQRTSIELRVERTGTSAAPVINAVALVIGDRTIVVPRNDRVFLHEVASLRIDASDQAAVATCNGQPMARAADGVLFDFAPWLKADGDGVCELRLTNAIGRSEAFRCVIVFDQTPPEVVVTAPAAPVAKGVAFDLRGRWVDPSGLSSARVGELAGDLSPGRGKARQGEWVVRMAPLDASADVTLVVEDRAGNSTTRSVHIEVK